MASGSVGEVDLGRSEIVLERLLIVPVQLPTRRETLRRKPSFEDLGCLEVSCSLVHNLKVDQADLVLDDATL